MVRRLFLGAGLFYLHLALVGRFVEAIGAVRCECSSACWCHRPLLSIFRWVFPFNHGGPAGHGADDERLGGP